LVISSPIKKKLFLRRSVLGCFFYAVKVAFNAVKVAFNAVKVFFYAVKVVFEIHYITKII
jgi:hypothetical protein